MLLGSEMSVIGVAALAVYNVSTMSYSAVVCRGPPSTRCTESQRLIVATRTDLRGRRVIVLS